MKLSDKYRERAARVPRAAQLYRSDMSRGMIASLVSATVHQLYQRTVWPVTYKMLNSIGTRRTGNVELRLGYQQRNKAAPYSARRLKMTGIGGSKKLGYYDKTMNPGSEIHNLIRGLNRQLGRLAQKKIIGD